MNMISTGAFLTETDASTKQNELVKKLTAAWEKKNSKTARAGGASLMALSLAACGGSEDDGYTLEGTTYPTLSDIYSAGEDAASAAMLATINENLGTSLTDANTSDEIINAVATSNDAAIAADSTAAAEAAAAEAATAAAEAAAASEAAAVAAAEATAAEAATAAVAAAEATAAEAAAAAAAELAALQALYDALTAPVSATLTDDDATGVGPDSLTGTAGADTYTATSTTLDATDVINGGDGSDVLNITATGAVAAANISNVETINVSIDTFAAGSIDLSNVAGATVNISTAKTVHNAGLTVAGVGDNTVNVTGVMTDLATTSTTFNAVGTSAINSGAYTSVNVNATTDAPIAVTLTAASADAIDIDGDNTSAIEVAANSADVTLGTDATLTTEDIGLVTVTATADLTATIANGGAGNDIATLTLAGANSIDVDGAELLTGQAIVDNTTAGTQTANVSTDAVDAGDWANSVVINLDAAAVNGVTVATGARVEAALNLTGATTITGAAATATTNTVTIDLSATQDTSTTLANFASATLELDNSTATALVDYNAFDSAGADMTISVAADATGSVAADVEFSTLDVDTGDATITGTGDVDISTSFTGVTLDASGLTGSIDVNDTVANAATTILGGSGANTVQFATTTGTATYTGKDGGDTVVVDEIAGTDATEGLVTITTGGGDDDLDGDVNAAGDFAAWTITSGAGDDTWDLATATSDNSVTLDMGAGDDTATMDTLTTSTVEGSMGAGDDTLSVDGLTTGTVVVDMGAGDDTVGIGGTTTLAAGANIVITTGAGTNTVTLGEVAALDAGVNVVIDGTGGTDTLALSSTNVSAATLSLTSVETIQIATGVTTIFSTAQLSGQSYAMQSSAGSNGVISIQNTTATAQTVDLSTLTINQGLGTAIQAVTLTVSGAGGNTITGTDAALTVDTITGGSGVDTIDGKAGDDNITGGAGADIMTGGAGADTFVAHDADDGIDVITDFTTADFIDTTNNAIAAYNDDTATDYSAQATIAAAAAAAFEDNDATAFVYGGKTYVVIDAATGAAYTSSADFLIDITGTDASTLVAGDFI
jgi:hypothetical protein